MVRVLIADDHPVFRAHGYTNQAIAKQPVISPKTVRNHISSISSKLQVTSRLEAILRTKDAGMS